jgi:outer membrane protein TolC
VYISASLNLCSMIMGKEKGMSTSAFASSATGVAMLLPVCVLGIVSVTAAFGQDMTSQVNVPADPRQNTAAPLILTLQDALARARKINPEYHAALTQLGIAKEDRVQSRAALLPNVNYTTEFLYTQGSGTRTNAPRFITNNAVHEYVSQGDAHQTLSLENIAEYRRTRAAETLARARAEIATRGLLVTVVRAYYAFIVAQRKYASVQRAAAEAQHFLDISQKLEHGGEVAHSDVVKAQIQAQTQQRELQEAELEMNRSRLELAVLIFPDFNENFAVVDDLQTPEPVPSFGEVQSAAGRKNPELRAAMAALDQARQEVAVAWNGFLPSLSFDYFYGIDADQFAIRAPNGDRNLGYAATASLQLPVWNWGANRSRSKQANLRRQQANIELTATQRELLSNLRIFYNEAQTARAELDSLNQSAELAAESLRLTTLRYQAGEATALEVVDAQNTLTQSRNALNDGQARFRLALANLQTLTGTL